MKQVTLLLFLISCFPAFSQTDKGRLLVGGDADISTTTQAGITNFNLNFSPRFGAFVINNLTIGGFYSFAIATKRTYDRQKNEYKTTSAFVSAVGPQLSYYIGKKPLKGLISANGGYSVYTVMIDGKIANKNGFLAGGFLGMAYFFNQHVALNSGAYTAVSGYEGDFPILRIGFSVGFSVLLDKKKSE